GYAGSRPVRVGNGARNQIQLDVYGEVVDALYEYVQRGGKLDGDTRRMVRAFGEFVCRNWDQPDHGIWEIRSECRNHTHSRAMCWVALDRLLRLHESGHLKIPVKKFRENRDAIAETIESGGWNEKLGSYVSTIGGDELDAVLLRLGRCGYADPASERMRSTCHVIYQRLGVDGLLYRYLDTADGLPPGEGAFGICSFWGVIARALAGDLDGAVSAFENLLGYANDLGLYAEEIDPVSGDALGNFPQAFTHVGLVDAALTIQQVREGRMEREKKGHAPAKETV
ncbi:MAG: glycoside hydrolase family 15 protein, partial [Gemmatimonadales bacterium]